MKRMGEIGEIGEAGEAGKFRKFGKILLPLFLPFPRFPLLPLLPLILPLFFSCTPERKLTDSQYLLVKNKVVADRKEIPTNNISNTVRPRVNKRTFGVFLTKVGIYQAMTPEPKPHYEQFKHKMRSTLGKYPVLLDTVTNDYHIERFNNFKLWTQKKFGEAPVLLDSSLIEYSLAQIQLTMQNSGYFNASVNYKVKFKQKRAKITYQITAGEPYRINQIIYQIPDPVANHVYRDTARSFIKRGDVFSMKNLENQRDRIQERLLNAGYFSFSKNDVSYRLDTNLDGQLLDLTLVVSNPRYKIDDSTVVEGKHRCYIVNSINILYDWNDTTEIDTVKYTEIIRKSKDTNDYLILYPVDREDYHRPSALVYPIAFSAGNVFSNRSSRNTYDRYFSDMRNFSTVRISYVETTESKENFKQDTGYLDCQIQLNRLKRQSLGFDLLLKNSPPIFGVGGELSYRNRNLFKSAEILLVSLKYTQELRIDSGVINYQNFELGGNIRLEFPRFLFPIKRQNIPKGFRPKTVIGFGANYLKQQYYARLLTNVLFSYEWSERKQRRRINHSVSVVDFNVVKMYKEPIFNDLTAGFSKRVLEKYKDHFLLGSNYRIILQDVSNRYRFQAKFDTYGNLLYVAMRAFGTLTDKYKNEYNQYSIWGISFASGIIVDVDFTYNLLNNKKSDLVYHAAVGAGFATANSSILPFEKSFYLGGSNSMRAWRLRTLGPGSYSDTNTNLLERVGDIKLEMNLEYRVPIYKLWNLGLFIDAGNMWLKKQNDEYPSQNAAFAFNRFFKEIALNAGVGIRFDLSFFIVRLDYAVKIHDPQRLDNSWCFMNWYKFKDFRADRTIVLGIGYPF